MVRIRFQKRILILKEKPGCSCEKIRKAVSTIIGKICLNQHKNELVRIIENFNNLKKMYESINE